MRWASSVSKFDAVTTPPRGSPEQEQVSLAKVEGRRLSLKVCVAEINPGQVAKNDRAPGQRGRAAALMFSSTLRELVRWRIPGSPQEQGRVGVGE